uniref:Uncharacterized protein n=1 Tax=Candidatus Kentrum sp. LPFa TaxID=2126335 RepID=A0A450W339_9GAMM|nr:MAG: hypothetical protein BECKLPF1236A_GA0070988_100553 [Candidatus Kentron sp. LPFa]VFK24562.1 MAG: hypothetical protein BECKLPF1236C_GA0070990_1001422 [Candidatus Kentron sp. LPFa]
MRSRWEKLGKIKSELINSIKQSPRDWLVIEPYEEKGYRLLKGNDLIVLDFNCYFFSRKDSGEGIDTTWAISFDNGLEFTRKIIEKYLSKKYIFNLRSPLVSKEKLWIAEVVTECQTAVIYARYEADDILIYEK